jgi:hypothetical protein
MNKIPRDIWCHILYFLQPKNPSIIIKKIDSNQDSRIIDPTLIDIVLTDGQIQITARTHYYVQSMFHSPDSNRYIQIGNPFVSCFCDFLNVEFLLYLRNLVIHGINPLQNIEKRIYLLNNKILKIQYYPVIMAPPDPLKSRRDVTDIILPRLVILFEENRMNIGEQRHPPLFGTYSKMRIVGASAIMEFIDSFIIEIQELH